ALRPAPPHAAPSRLFAAGGYAVMRSGWDPTAYLLILDGGPLGCMASGGHGHADLLSIQCCVAGEPYLVDPGTYGYTTGPTCRTLSPRPPAKAPRRADGVGQAVPVGPFRWKRRPAARLCRWLSTEAVDFVDAHHDAYRRLEDPVTHRRRVLFVKPRYWI